jgi:hypothetical protein
VTDRYLDALLLDALTAPGATNSPSAGRIIGQLLGVAAAAGDGDAIAPYLTAFPGRPSNFEVHRYRPGETQPTVVAANLNAADAVRLAMLPLPEDAAGVEVISRDASGLLRCAVVKPSRGQLEYLFPAADSFDGNPSDVTQAHRQWIKTLASWSVRAHPGGDGQDAQPARAAHRNGTPATDESTALVPVTPPALPAVNGGHDVLEVVRSALAQMTVEVDLQEVEDLIRRTVAEGPPMATPRDVARVLAKVVPSAGDIADAVAEKVAAAITSSASPASPAAAAVPASGADRRLVSALLEAMERLATEMHEVRDQVRKSRTQLDTVEARVNTLAETRSSIEHLRDALTGDLDRLGQRLEHQVKESLDRGESVPSGEQIANLSRRLRRSSIYLDRVLGRLDELVSYQTGGPPPNGTSRVAYPEAAELDR